MLTNFTQELHITNVTKPVVVINDFEILASKYCLVLLREALDIFLDFFEKRQYLFVVVDEYGSVTGVISMEDILEEILGREIVDESDTARNMQDLARRWKNTRWKK